MSDTAAHLTDRVLPHVHVRQWVLSLPYALRYRMAYDAELTGDVLRIFVRRVFASMKRRARAQWGIKEPQCGAVTFVQRFGGALNLNVHFYTLVLGRIATGPRAGQEVMRFGDFVKVERLATTNATRCISLGGLSLHANVSVPAGDRQRLERLCRYVARPPVATERLTRLSDGRLMYELRYPWRDGTTHVAFLPLELMEKLAALVPPPDPGTIHGPS